MLLRRRPDQLRGLWLWLTIALACATGVRATPGRGHEIVACGESRVYVLELMADGAPGSKSVWVWDARDDPRLPKLYREQYFTKIDEAKPVDDGRLFAITSSSGGVAVLDRGARQVRAFGILPNAHSVEWLWGQWLVVAGSNHPQGNSLAIFPVDQLQAGPVWQDKLESAHGVVWVQESRSLYALGGTELRRYNWPEDSIWPVLGNIWPLPEDGGHDLQPLPGSGDLVLSTRQGVWRFRTGDSRFEAFSSLGQQGRVKSISVHPETARIAWVQSHDNSRRWWSDRIRLSAPDGELSLPDLRLYKNDATGSGLNGA